LAQVRGSVGQRPYLCVCGCARCGDAEGADPDRPCHPPGSIARPRAWNFWRARAFPRTHEFPAPVAA